LIFWDFDGVIKDSVEVKADAFEELFLPFGKDVAGRVRRHHEDHGGMSRFEKMPVYLGWAGIPDTKENIREYCGRFSELALQGVIDAPWVPGVREYLEMNHRLQPFILITATPEEEIVAILSRLGIDRFFREVHGAPKKKSMAVKEVLERYHLNPGETLLIGDSSSDYQAALENGVPFLLRRTTFNAALQKLHNGPSFERLDS
jgi:phosphoglycolate phosphatase-like HAD superfamily hydrolase